MRLRTIGLIVILALGLLAGPLPVEAEKPGKVYRIGYVGSSPSRRAAYLHDAFRQGLRELGYIEADVPLSPRGETLS